MVSPSFMMRAPGAMELDERKVVRNAGRSGAGRSWPIVSMVAATRPSSTAEPRAGTAGRQAAELRSRTEKQSAREYQIVAGAALPNVHTGFWAVFDRPSGALVR